MAKTVFFNPKEKTSVVTRFTNIIGPEEKRAVDKTANIICIDNSGSMSEAIGRGDTRPKIEGVKEAITLYLSKMSQSAYASIIPFESTASVLWPLSPLNDRLQVINEVQKMSPNGSTAMKEALAEAISQLKKAPGGYIPRVFIFSDGIPDESPESMADALKKMGARITTIGFGDNQNIDEALLRTLASTSPTGPEYYHFLDSAKMSCFMAKKTQVL